MTQSVRVATRRGPAAPALSPEEETWIRRRHAPVQRLLGADRYWACAAEETDWPCLTARILATIDAVRAGLAATAEPADRSAGVRRGRATRTPPLVADPEELRTAVSNARLRAASPRRTGGRPR